MNKYSLIAIFFVALTFGCLESFYTEKDVFGVNYVLEFPVDKLGESTSNTNRLVQEYAVSEDGYYCRISHGEFLKLQDRIRYGESGSTIINCLWQKGDFRDNHKDGRYIHYSIFSFSKEDKKRMDKLLGSEHQ